VERTPSNRAVPRINPPAVSANTRWLILFAGGFLVLIAGMLFPSDASGPLYGLFIALGGLVLTACAIVFSSSRWIRTYWPLLLLTTAIFLSDSTFRFRSYTDKSVDLQVALKMIAWGIEAFVAIYYLSKAKNNILTYTTLSWGAFFFWCICTFPEAPNPLFSFIAAGSLAIFFVYFLALFNHYGEMPVVWAVIASIAVLTIASLAAYYFVPSFGHMWLWHGNYYSPVNRLRGVTSSANVIGAAVASGTLLMAIYWRALRAHLLLKLGLLFIFLWALYLSDNRWATFSVAFIALAYYKFSFRRPLAIFIVVAAAIFGILLVSPFTTEIMQALSRSGNANEILTGTNRTAIWAVAIKLWQQRPLVGWGYASGFFILPLQVGLFADAADTHNLFLEILFGTGLIGAVLFFLAASGTLRAAWKRSDRRALALFAFILMHGITEAQPVTGVAGPPLPTLLIAVLVCFAKRAPQDTPVAARPRAVFIRPRRKRPALPVDSGKPKRLP